MNTSQTVPGLGQTISGILEATSQAPGRQEAGLELPMHPRLYKTSPPESQHFGSPYPAARAPGPMPAFSQPQRTRVACRTP